MGITGKAKRVLGLLGPLLSIMGDRAQRELDGKVGRVLIAFLRYWQNPQGQEWPRSAEQQLGAVHRELDPRPSSVGVALVYTSDPDRMGT